ncbi:SDR family NAD(P)-dependent oxidoreductase [Pollutimonas sp. M17]|uniref:SDR family NAD(P)-dependent oxidoreductase n=1 Tax=Pollutimonas sp. M17 TaxID=2962065 RepID=UPI0021F3D469|nr:SDR family oxidoreductase [Pollutimonas sp. M17]UYO92757.1 SDR family oxidoreductase [Pollutimonas sp. M17]
MDVGFRLDGKVALVTGAAGALGSHFAGTLGHAGATVVLAGRRLQPLKELAARLHSNHITAHPVHMDVGDPASVEQAFDEAWSLCGGVDVLVCNAGVAVNKKALDIPFDEWSQVVDTNLKGSWLVCRQAARRLADAGRPGSIITVTSILGHRVAAAVLPYAASKAGLEHMTRAMALEWARHGIRVNALAPGYIETSLNSDFFASEAGQALIRRIPQRRLGRPQDLDGALLLLASDASLYMTGSSIVVDGGHLQSSL